MGFLSSYSPKKRLGISIGWTKFIAEGRAISHTNYYNCIIHKTLSCSKDCTPSTSVGLELQDFPLHVDRNRYFVVGRASRHHSFYRTGAFPSVSLQESEQELEKFCRYLHRSNGDEPFTSELRGTAPVPAQHRLGLVRAWLRVRHSQASTAGFPPVSHGRMGVSLQARSRDPRWGARCRATPSPGHRLGGSCAQRSDKALIAESRRSASFYVQFILEASIVSEAK